MVKDLYGLKTEGYDVADDVDSVLGPVQFNQGFGARPVLMNAQQSDNPSSTPGEHGSSGGQQDQQPPSGTAPSQGAKAPQQVYDPDNRLEYDIDGGVLPKGVKPDYFSIDGQVYGQTRRGQVWKQTGDGQWTSVHESEAEGIRSKRGDAPQQPVPQQPSPQQDDFGLNDSTRDWIGKGVHTMTGPIASQGLKHLFPRAPWYGHAAGGGLIGWGMGAMTKETLPKQKQQPPR